MHHEATLDQLHQLLLVSLLSFYHPTYKILILLHEIVLLLCMVVVLEVDLRLRCLCRQFVPLSTMKIIPHCLTATFSLTGIRSLADVGNRI